jgi:hypothetical protein
MWRSLCMVAVVYGCGHPGLDGYRPVALDAPLQAFYQQVNKAAQDGQRMLASVNESRASYFHAYMGRARKQLRTAEQSQD